MPAPLSSDCRPFERLYRDHHPWLVTRLQRWLGCPEQAADIAADTFVQLLTVPPESLEQPRALLTVIARRLVWRMWRRRGVEHEYLARLEDPLETEPLERHAHQVRLLDRLGQALSRIPARLRQAFVLAHLHGFSHRQIADRLSVSLRCVGLYLTRVRRHCALWWEPVYL